MARDDPAERILAYLDREGVTPAARMAEDLGMAWGDLAEHALALDADGHITAVHATGQGLVLGPADADTGTESDPGGGQDGHDPWDVEPGSDLNDLRETVQELASRMKSMQQTLTVHQQRMDRVNASQSVFEREVAELMQDHRSIIADLREQHRSMQRRMDMLLEAFEEGLDEADAAARDAVAEVRDRIAVDHDSGGVLADELDVLQDKIERLEERKSAAEHLKTRKTRENDIDAAQLEQLADRVTETRERLDRVERMLAERWSDERGTPTVVE